MRLFRRYVNQFTDSFTQLDSALVNMSNVIDMLSVDHAALCLYNIQYAVAYHEVTISDIVELTELSNELAGNMEKVCSRLTIKIADEEKMRDLLPIKSLGIQKSLKRSIDSKVKFISSSQNWITQIKYLISAMATIQLKK